MFRVDISAHNKLRDCSYATLSANCAAVDVPRYVWRQPGILYNVSVQVRAELDLLQAQYPWTILALQQLKTGVSDDVEVGADNTVETSIFRRVQVRLLT